MIETWRDNNTFWRAKRALVTGGAGFLCSYVVKKLRDCGCGEVFVPRSKDYDLTQLPAVQKFFADHFGGKFSHEFLEFSRRKKEKTIRPNSREAIRSRRINSS